jgi:hypothetical protein
MKVLVKSAIFLFIILIFIACSPAQQMVESKGNVTPLNTPGAMRDGSIVYGLPRTVFTVVARIERTVEKPGPYAQYAEALLGLTDVIKNENESWSIETVTLKSHDELDPSEYYVISSTNLFQTNVLALKKEGLILDLNPEIFKQDRKPGIAEESGNLHSGNYDLGSDEYFQTQRDTAYKRMNIDSSFVRVPYIVEKQKKLSVDQLAEKAAKRLMELRDGKHLILTGEATVFPQSDAAINEINRMEKAYTELFTGKTFRETLTFTYELIPQKAMVGKPVELFLFSEARGPVSGSGGKAVTMEFIPEKKTKDLVFSGKSEEKKYDKLFYRVPDVVGIKINLGSEKLYDSRKLIYQFGETIQLPANYIIGK